VLQAIEEKSFFLGGSAGEPGMQKLAERSVERRLHG